MAGAGEHPPAPGTGLPGRRIASTQIVPRCSPASGPTGGGLAVFAAAAARSLRAPGRQRLLRAPSVIGRRIEITAELHRVRVFCDGRIVADHERVWAKHQTIHDPEHLVAATTLRRQRLEVVRPPVETEVETRRLSDYDALLGVDGGVA